MTTTGRITEFPIPTPASEPGGIVAGPDGAVWFTEFFGNRIGRIEAGSTAVLPPRPAPLQIHPSQSSQSAPAHSSCRVPKVRGLTVRRARKKLRRARCRFRIQGKGRIVASRPRAGTRTSSRVQLRAKRKRH
jgi:hypothetical protein